jgi:hypothetical protein
MMVYKPYSVGIKTMPTKNFHVANTSLPAILTDEEASASLAFFALNALAVMTIGRFNMDLIDC